jgi:RNA polymerase sigma-70 factor (ECF subfamily)
MTASDTKVPEDSVRLVQQWRLGDESAAAEIVNRYLAALIDRTRHHLSEKLARRFDAEDVAQSACLSFFVGARDGKYVIQRSGELWALLTAIARHKLLKQVERHTAARRSIDLEVQSSDLLVAVIDPDFAAALPSHAETLSVANLVEGLLDRLDAIDRQILVLRLDGLTLDEIAQQINRSQRTVRRVMQRIRESLIAQSPELGALS